MSPLCRLYMSSIILLQLIFSSSSVSTARNMFNLSDSFEIWNQRGENIQWYLILCVRTRLHSWPFEGKLVGVIVVGAASIFTLII